MDCNEQTNLGKMRCQELIQHCGFKVDQIALGGGMIRPNTIINKNTAPPKPVVSLIIAACEFSYVLVSTSNVASAIVTPPIRQIH